MLVANTHGCLLLLIQPYIMHSTEMSLVLSHDLVDTMIMFLRSYSQVLRAGEDLKVIVSLSWMNVQEKVLPRLHLQTLLLAR